MSDHITVKIKLANDDAEIQIGRIDLTKENTVHAECNELLLRDEEPLNIVLGMIEEWVRGVKEQRKEITGQDDREETK